MQKMNLLAIVTAVLFQQGTGQSLAGDDTLQEPPDTQQGKNKNPHYRYQR